MPWRLIVLYFGLTFLGIGAAVYNLSCPSQIKKYPSPVEYAKEEGDHWATAAHYTELCQKLGISTNEVFRRLGTIYRGSSPAEILGETQRPAPEVTEIAAQHAFGARARREHATELLAQDWEQSDRSRKALCCMAAAFYFLGFGPLLAMSVVTIGEVLISSLRLLEILSGHSRVHLLLPLEPKQLANMRVPAPAELLLLENQATAQTAFFA